MTYRFAVADLDYSDLASGRVLYSRPGTTGFPVRLASELFQRCQDYLTQQGDRGPYVLYDPCCGGAYLLAAIGFLHGKEIAAILASDVDPQAVELARRNLSLLTVAGLDRRITELHSLADRYGKDSHREALASASRLREMALARAPIDCCCLVRDVTAGPVDGVSGVGIVITDVPYGAKVQWSGAAPEGPLHAMLANLEGTLRPGAVFALISPKRTSAAHPSYERVSRFGLGKRQITMLRHRA